VRIYIPAGLDNQQRIILAQSDNLSYSQLSSFSYCHDCPVAGYIFEAAARPGLAARKFEQTARADEPALGVTAPKGINFLTEYEQIPETLMGQLAEVLDGLG